MSSSPVARKRPKKPGIALVFGILNLCFGAFDGCAGGVASFVMLVPAVAEAMGDNAFMELMHQNSLYTPFSIAGAVLALLGSLVLIASGLGLVMIKPWGRSLALAYCAYALIWALVSFVLQLVVFLPPVWELAAVAPDEEMILLYSSGGMALASPCLGLIYPVILLIFMLRPGFAQQLREYQPPPKESA